MEFVENFDEICRKKTRIFLLGNVLETVTVPLQERNNRCQWKFYFSKKILFINFSLN